MITDGNGDRKEKIEYFPFGEYRAVGNTNGTYDYDPNFPDVYYTFTGQEDDDDLGFYNYGARLYDPVLGRFISPDSVVQAPGDPQTLNRYSYARNNPLIYVDPSGNVFGIDDIILAISVILVNSIGVTAGATAYAVATCITYVGIVASGAALGAATSAITGGDVGLGALTGAISAGLFYGAGSLAGEIGGALGAAPGSLGQVAITTGVHFAAGAASGAINSAITGGNIGVGALTGAVAAGVGSLAGNILPDGFGYQLIGQTVVGGIAGGVVSDIYGGNFWRGFAQGAETAAAAFLFNYYVHWRRTPDGRVESMVIDPKTGTLVYPGTYEDPFSRLIGDTLSTGAKIVDKFFDNPISNEATKVAPLPPTGTAVDPAIIGYNFYSFVHDLYPKYIRPWLIEPLIRK